MDRTELETTRGVYASQCEGSLHALSNYWKTVDRVLIEGDKTDEDPEFTVTDVLRGDSEKLDEEIERHIRRFFVNVLELLECGLADEDPRLRALYKQLRPKILRGGNDAIRDLQKVLDQYHILKVLDTEEVVNIKFEGEESNG